MKITGALAGIVTLLMIHIPASAVVDSVRSSTDCFIGMLYLENGSQGVSCGTRSTSTAGQEIESNLAVRQRWEDPQPPIAQLGHDGFALSRARSSYGNLGVYALGNTIAFSIDSSGRTFAIAYSQAGYSDVATISSSTLAIGVTIPVTFGITINRSLSALSTGNTGWRLSKSTLDARLSFTALDQFSNPVLSLLSFNALGCSPIPCQTAGTVLEPEGIDIFQWTLNLRVGDRVSIQGYLRAEAEGVYRSDSLGSNSGTGTATVQSYNSAHSFFRVDEPSALVAWSSGTVYPTSPVPEVPSIALLVCGLVALLVVARPKHVADNNDA